MSLVRALIKGFFHNRNRYTAVRIPKTFVHMPTVTPRTTTRTGKKGYVDYTEEEMQREFAILDAGVGRNRNV